MSDNQWGAPGQYPQQPPQQGQVPPPGNHPPSQGQYYAPPSAQGGNPHYGNTQHGAPQYSGGPQYGGPPQYGTPQSGVPLYGGSQYGGMPQGLGWGAPQPGGPQRPPKKRSSARVVLLVLSIAVLGVVGLVAGVNLLKGDPSYTSEPYPTTTYNPTSGPSETPTAAPPTSATKAPPATQPTRTTQPPVKPTAPRTTSAPKPKPGPTNLQLVSINRLYKAGTMPSVNCKESKARPSTVAGARTNYLNLRNCLNRAWPALVRKAGGTFRPPTVMVFSGNVSTPCGVWSDSGPPFYCSGNETIYMNLTEDIGNYNRHPENYQRVWARMWMLHQFAHEYGHHVQNLTGIFQASSRLRYEAPSKALELQGSRRLELQASCFSDIFIGANKRSYPLSGESLRQWQWLIGATIDPQRDHGSKSNHKYWAQKGYTSRSPASCNTFTASAARVS